MLKRLLPVLLVLALSISIACAETTPEEPALLHLRPLARLRPETVLSAILSITNCSRVKP